VEEINTLLRSRDLTANVIHSFGQYLDLVPIRASKGQALRYVAHRFGIPLEHVLVAGGSGADEDMMRGNTLAVVVANRHHEELSQLADLERIYFAERPHALGILEAIDHYDFFRTCRVPEAQELARCSCARTWTAPCSRTVLSRSPRGLGSASAASSSTSG
jgi:sucrose-phosphate synthase